MGARRKFRQVLQGTVELLDCHHLGEARCRESGVIATVKMIIEGGSHVRKGKIFSVEGLPCIPSM